MKTLTTQIKRIFHEEDGVTSIEYAIIASLMAIVIVSAWQLIADGLESKVVKISDELKKL